MALPADRFWTTACIAALFAGTSASAAVLRVPEEYSTILAAVDAAVSGDSVLVGPGTWTDVALRRTPGEADAEREAHAYAAYLKPGIAVIATHGPRATTIATGRAASPLRFAESAGTEPTLVSGFTLTGGSCLWSSQPSVLELENCRLTDCDREAAFLSNGAIVLLRDCTVLRNSFKDDVIRGALTSRSSTLELYDCVIRDNQGQGVKADYGRLVMERCEIRGQTLDSRPLIGGTGVEVNRTEVQIRNCRFQDNTGSGVRTTYGTGIIENCLFYRNSDSGLWMHGTIRITANTFVACRGALGSALILYADLGGVDHNIFAFNIATTEGAIWFGSPRPSSLSGCNLFFGNMGGDFTMYGNWTPSPTDVFADPLFCDREGGIFSLDSASPAAAGNHPDCGRIGARGIGCRARAAESRSWGEIKALYR